MLRIACLTLTLHISRLCDQTTEIGDREVILNVNAANGFYFTSNASHSGRWRVEVSSGEHYVYDAQNKFRFITRKQRNSGLGRPM